MLSDSHDHRMRTAGLENNDKTKVCMCSLHKWFSLSIFNPWLLVSTDMEFTHAEELCVKLFLGR